MRIEVEARATFRTARYPGLLFLFAAALNFSMACAHADPVTPSTSPSGQAPTPGISRPVAGIPSTTQETTVVQTTTVTKVKADGVLVHTDIPSDLSIEGMFKAADPIVKIVMGLLAGASIATWSIFFFKLVELTIARSRAGTDLRKIAAASSLRLAAASLRKGPVAMLSRAAEQEIAASDTLPAEGIKERVAIALQRIESNASRRIGAGTGVLASVGSTGPFIGLFGTVWGIMNSFIHISNAHTTNLSVVAPGIAEALLATAMGLVAAIPAVVIYNMFSRWIAAYRLLLGDGSAVIMRHVSRDLDRIASTHSRVAAE